MKEALIISMWRLRIPDTFINFPIVFVVRRKDESVGSNKNMWVVQTIEQTLLNERFACSWKWLRGRAIELILNLLETFSKHKSYLLFNKLYY